MEVRVYRNVDSLKLRKWVVELWHGEKLLDRRRLFGGLGFARRLSARIKRMKHMAGVAAEVVAKS